MKLTWLGHASIKIITNENHTIYIDPYFGEEYNDKADLILSTHSHFDHSSMEKIKQLLADETKILTSEENAPNINGIPMKPGDEQTHKGIRVIAVPAYNTNKFRSPGVEFHPKDFGLGFLIKVDQHTIYFAGDTDFIPEMSQIKADIALIPIGGTYTMNFKEAAQAINTIKPKLAIPIHYGSGIVGTKQDAEEFKQLVESEVQILEIGQTIEI